MFNPGDHVIVNRNFHPYQTEIKGHTGTVDFYVEDPMPYVGVVLDKDYHGTDYWGFYPEDLDKI